MKDLRAQLNQKQNILDKIQKKRLLWFEHVVRRGEESYVYRSYKKITRVLMETVLEKDHQKMV